MGAIPFPVCHNISLYVNWLSKIKKSVKAQLKRQTINSIKMALPTERRTFETNLARNLSTMPKTMLARGTM